MLGLGWEGEGLAQFALRLRLRLMAGFATTLPMSLCCGYSA